MDGWRDPRVGWMEVGSNRPNFVARRRRITPLTLLYFTFSSNPALGKIEKKCQATKNNEKRWRRFAPFGYRPINYKLFRYRYIIYTLTIFKPTHIYMPYIISYRFCGKWGPGFTVVTTITKQSKQRKQEVWNYHPTIGIQVIDTIHFYFAKFGIK